MHACAAPISGGSPRSCRRPVRRWSAQCWRSSRVSWSSCPRSWRRARAGGWPGSAGERRRGRTAPGSGPKPPRTGRTWLRCGQDGRARTPLVGAAAAFEFWASVLPGEIFGRPSVVRPRSTIAAKRNTSTHYSGESTVPFLIHSLVSIEPSLIVSLLSDTSSGELFPVIIGLSVWYRRRRRRPYADRWGRQSPCSTGLARLPPRIAWPRTGGARPGRTRLRSALRVSAVRLIGQDEAVPAGPHEKLIRSDRYGLSPP